MRDGAPIADFPTIGWNHSINSIPRPDIPPVIRPNAKVDITTVPRQTSSGYVRPLGVADFLRDRLTTIFFTYLILDFLLIQMVTDPYTLSGPDRSLSTTSSPQQHYPPWAQTFYRECLSLVCIWSTITLLFASNDLVLYPIFRTFFPSRAALWQFPTTFGGIAQVPNRGLAGWWGAWWHQTFRLSFLGPSVYLINKGYIRRGSKAADAFGLFISFFQSSLLHVAGSFTALPPTKLWRPMAFFLLQGVGIFLQQQLISVLKRPCVNAPRLVRQTGNVLFCLLWLCLTAPMFLDDLASAGLWLHEPIPISPFRLLGFGRAGDHWWRWDRHTLPRWSPAKHWWEVGIAL